MGERLEVQASLVVPVDLVAAVELKLHQVQEQGAQEIRLLKVHPKENLVELVVLIKHHLQTAVVVVELVQLVVVEVVVVLGLDTVVLVETTILQNLDLGHNLFISQELLILTQHFMQVEEEGHQKIQLPFLLNQVVMVEVDLLVHQHQHQGLQDRV